MERRGSGLKKILKEYEEKELPEFYSEQQFFTVMLKNKNYVNDRTTPKTDQKTDQKTNQKTEDLIMDLIKFNPKITQNQISKQLGNISPSGVKYNLKKLKDKGFIKRIGADKGGYWEITKLY